MSGNPIRVATAAISRRIFAGRPTKDGLGFKEPRYDVTSDVYRAIRDSIGVGHEIEVGLPGAAAEFRIAVLPPSTTPSQGLDAATVERCAIRDYLTACAAAADTQAERFAGHDASIVAACRAEAKAYRNAARMIEAQDHASRREQITAALATDPHQHGAGNGETAS
ncbi:hypothetical protein [Sphingomonas sp.]|uniref:DUF7446 family protein n=1 Tax=Sphingomonadales TaxID=204457 RepID=UPI0035C78DBC